MGAEWWALVVPALGLALTGVRMWWIRRGRTAERLRDLHEKLRQLKESALGHLDVQAGEPPTETDVRRCREQVVIDVRRAPWEDVRAAAERLLEECDRVLIPRVREAPFERREAIRRDIQTAFDAATNAIGARLERVRG